MSAGGSGFPGRRRFLPHRRRCSWFSIAPLGGMCRSRVLRLKACCNYRLKPNGKVGAIPHILKLFMLNNGGIYVCIR